MTFILYLHLLSIALAIGAGAAHIQLMRDASKGGADAHTFIIASRSVKVKAELPGYVIAIITGITLVIMNPARLHEGWLHAKLTGVLILLGFLHLEGRRMRQALRTYVEGDHVSGLEKARSYANKLVLLPTVLVLAIVYLAVARPF